MLGRGHRQKQPYVLVKNYVTHSSHVKNTHSSHDSSDSDLGASTTVSGNIPYPITNYISDAVFSSNHKAFLAAITSEDEPASYQEALRDKVWRDSMTDEHQKHIENGTWDVTTLPPGKKVISCQWIYKNKYHSDGTLSRHKSRLVACGNRKKEAYIIKIHLPRH